MGFRLIYLSVEVIRVFHRNNVLRGNTGKNILQKELISINQNFALIRNQNCSKSIEQNDVLIFIPINFTALILIRFVIFLSSHSLAFRNYLSCNMKL